MAIDRKNMATIHERLRHAAQAGSEASLKALLRHPCGDARAQDQNGRTALMWAAWNGHEACVSLLMPASDLLAKNEDGLTANGLAADRGHEGLARFIDAYALAQSERVSLEVAVGP